MLLDMSYSCFLLVYFCIHSHCSLLFYTLRVRNADTSDELNQLNGQETVLNTLVTAGFVNKLLTKENKDVACEKVMVHFAVINQKMEMDGIRRRLKIIQLASTMEKNRHLWCQVFPRMNDVKVSQSVRATKVTLNSSAGEMDESQKQAFDWCKDYAALLPSKYNT